MLADKGPHELIAAMRSPRAGDGCNLSHGPEDRARMGAEGRRVVEESFSEDVVVEATVGMVRRVAAGGAPGRG